MQNLLDMIQPENCAETDFSGEKITAAFSSRIVFVR
jgi:hypothetical protein